MNGTVRRRGLIGGNILGNKAYIKCNYVTSSDPTTIITNIAPIGSKWVLDLEASPTDSNQIFICSYSDGGFFAAINSSGNFALGVNNVLSSATIRSKVLIEFITDGIVMKIGNDRTQRVNTSRHHGDFVHLLGYNNTFKYTGKIYRIKCVSGASFNAIPARRISDGVYGIYDTANDVFYSGNFTGA